MLNNNLILLHGALGSSADMKNLSGYLQEKGLQTHLFEFSGHGQKTFANDFGIRQFSEELSDFIIHNGLQGASVFGYSMGGFVALYNASTATGLTGTIITLATKLNWTPEIIKQESGFCDLDFLKQKVPAFAENLKAKHLDHKQLLKKTASMIRDFDGKTLIPEDWQPGQKIFLGLGDRDKLVTVEECRNFTKNRKSCGMYMLPFTAHPFDQADHHLLAGMIKRMLEKA